MLKVFGLNSFSTCENIGFFCNPKTIPVVEMYRNLPDFSQELGRNHVIESNKRTLYSLYIDKTESYTTKV